MERILHIVSPAIPYPANEGRFLDIFYKIRALYKEGVSIHLHCFKENQPEQSELNKYCSSVHYYPVGNGHKGISFSIPYHVASRYNESLMDNLLKDDYPILLEGVQAAYIARDSRFKNRNISLRITQLEHDFYKESAGVSGSIFQKLMYHHQSCLFKTFEKSLPKNLKVFIANGIDSGKVVKDLKWAEPVHVPLFLPFQKVVSQEGTGSYCLYHGNLKMPANERAAFFLLEKVFNDSQIPFVVAGKDPSNKLIRAAKSSNFSCIVENPSEAELQDMIARAQINIIPSFIESGTPIKLLNSLLNGRHCIVNEKMIKGTGLEKACHVAGSPQDFIKITEKLFHLPFPEDEIIIRSKLLEREYNNQRNADKIIQNLW